MRKDGVENRREPRYGARVKGTLLRGKREPLALETSDVSVHGLFLRTNEAPPVRQLVKVELALPAPHARILLHGMVVYARKAAAPGLPAGFGVQLVGMGGDTLAAWRAFVRSTARVHDDAEELSDDDILEAE